MALLPGENGLCHVGVDLVDAGFEGSERLASAPGAGSEHGQVEGGFVHGGDGLGWHLTARMNDDALVAAIERAASSLPEGTLDRLIELLRAGASDGQIRGAVPTPNYEEIASELLAARAAQDPVPDGPALALALAAAREREHAAHQQRVSIVWTGPETDAVPVRRTDQALLELIARANRKLIVVSFAVYKVREVADALIAAAQRACDVVVVLESEAESGGKVTYEMAAALGSDVPAHAKLYTWPYDLRPETGSGKRASLHAKCAVADGERLLVSSANLTEYAFTKNMELGLLVEGGDIPSRVNRHFDALITDGVLRPIQP
jgi:phosphatidylserine/phosphatidylglycerophosphate/cardiolipin synthase-like enzyme